MARFRFAVVRRLRGGARDGRIPHTPLLIDLVAVRVDLGAPDDVRTPVRRGARHSAAATDQRRFRIVRNRLLPPGIYRRLQYGLVLRGILIQAEHMTESTDRLIAIYALYI